MALVDYTSLVDALVRDDNDAITAPQRDDAVGLAVLRYSQDRPRTGGEPHLLDAATDTISPGDREAVALWAAALLLDQLAARHAGDTDSTIGADGVDRHAQADRYRRLAKDHRARYAALLGLDRPPAAGVVAALDRGRRRPALTH